MTGEEKQGERFIAEARRDTEMAEKRKKEADPRFARNDNFGARERPTVRGEE